MRSGAAVPTGISSTISIRVDIFGHECLCLNLDRLIAVKRAAGRPKDKTTKCWPNSKCRARNRAESRYGRRATNENV